MPPATLDAAMAEAAGTGDFLIVEGAMGLFDGAGGEPGRTGAAADLATRFGLPVILVVDVTGQSQTAAAVVRGLSTHDPGVHIAGVILNRVASERHRAYAADAIAAIGIPVFGAIPRDEAMALPSRHLGLVQAGEHEAIEAWLDRVADTVERHVDLDRLLEAFGRLEIGDAQRQPAIPPPGQRIALASDTAFTFVYPHLLSAWRRAGAEMVTFSPLADEPPPENCDCCWLPGGYPELHAGILAGAARFQHGLREFALTRPVHGECGGYMVLGAGLVDADGVRHAMVGLLGHATSFAERRLTLGYRTGRLLADCAVGVAGHTIRGHEFRYSVLLEAGNDDPVVELFDAQHRPLGKAGGRRGKVSGTYFHAIADEALS